MNVLVADLHEDAARVGEQLAAEDEPVTQVRQVRVDAEGPGVPVGLDHLRLAGEVGLLVLHVAPADLGLEVRGEPDAVGRVHVDHLDPPGQALAAGQACHHLEGVAEDHPVRPVHVVLVELDGLAIRELGVGEQVALDVLARGHAEDGLGGHALVDVEGDRLDLEPLPLPLARPLEPRLLRPEGGGQDLGLLLGQRAGAGGFQERGQAVGSALGIGAEDRREVWVVRELEPGCLPDASLGGEPSGRVVLALFGVAVVADGRVGRPGGLLP